MYSLTDLALAEISIPSSPEGELERTGINDTPSPAGGSAMTRLITLRCRRFEPRHCTKIAPAVWLDPQALEHSGGKPSA